MITVPPVSPYNAKDTFSDINIDNLVFYSQFPAENEYLQKACPLH